MAELGPALVNKSTYAVFDSKGEIYCYWNLAFYTDVIFVGAPENYRPLFALLSVNLSTKKKVAPPCPVLAFNNWEFLLEVDDYDTIWAIGRSPGAQIMGLQIARIYPNPSKEYTIIIGPGITEENRQRIQATSTGLSLYTPGLQKGIIGFTINCENKFLLCDRMHPEKESSKFNNILLSYIMDKNGNFLRDPIEIPIEESAFKVVPSSNLSETRGLSLSSIFTEGTRLVNYGKDKIYAVVIYEERIYIIHLSEDGKPIKADKQRIVKPLKLPKEWNPSLRLWTYLTKDTGLFYIFGIDEEANFYWETVTVE